MKYFSKTICKFINNINKPIQYIMNVIKNIKYISRFIMLYICYVNYNNSTLFCLIEINNLYVDIYLL